ncbi:MAG: DUF3262 family protein [Gammaproteobacteria bacterium]|nr:DUF3262 family protein [Gammaproteobacteria bacterium]
MFEAFNTAAGFSVADLSLFFRSIFAAIVTLWAGWVAYRQFFLFTDGKIRLGEWGKNMIFLIIMWTFLMILIVV